MRLPIVTINAQGVTDPSRDVLESSVTPLPAMALAFYQEATPVRLLLRRKLDRRLVGVAQAKARLDKAGVALAWDKARLEAIDGGTVLLADPDAGVDMRKRYGVWRTFRVTGTTLVVDAMSAHRPLRSTGEQAEFDRRLSTWIRARRRGRPVIVGLDVNGSGAILARGMGLDWQGAGIDGFLHSPELALGRAFALDATQSDHRPVASIWSVA